MPAHARLSPSWTDKNVISVKISRARTSPHLQGAWRQCGGTPDLEFRLRDDNHQMHIGYLLHLHSRLTHTHNCPTIHRHLLVGGWPLLKVAWLGWESAQRDGVSHGSGHFVPLQHSAVSYPFLTTWCGFVPPTGEAKHSSKWRQTL